MIGSLLWPAILLAGLSFETLFGSHLDTFFISSLTLWKDRHLIAAWSDEYLGESIPSLALKVFLGGAIAYIWVYARLRTILDVATNDQPKWEGFGKPMLIPAKTTHRRTFPKTHAFAYSYLVVGFPVGWEGSAGGMVSTNGDAEKPADSWFPTTTTPSKGWYHVDGADHLERGPGSLKTKLHAYLESQGRDPSAYPHAYLVTAASFLGYNFNPVSFWYLYSAAKELTAMILEVNNTFGERRMYLLEAEKSPDSATTGEQQRFTHAWPKDFHVSPFNSRFGSYSLVIRDILAASSKGSTALDGTITLKSSKDHAKIVARLFATGSSVDPAAMGSLQRARFLLAWWWVGFVTFPRIVKEAGKLFFQRKLHVWFRPEPLQTTIAREATAAERQLEPIFRQYLRYLVARSGADLSLTYIPAPGVGDKEIMRTRAAQAARPSEADDATTMTASGGGKGQRHLDFQVLTPAFYTRFVRYAHDFEAVFAELRENQTIHVSRPELLPDIFVSKTPAASLSVGSALDAACFQAIKALRQPPERIERPLTSAAAPAARDTATHTVRDVRGFRISGMDGFVLGHVDGAMRRRYAGIVLREFLADKLAGGSAEVLWLQGLAVRGAVAWVIASGLGVISRQFLDRFEI
ncbi:hypothetical protein F5X68DRAFT_257723 [Plectosphaerella plurivora]|uniref:Uncharacterized protein n=1 Tax=Plectosphaerella plurivora TaxID=936078 RepID=A0A9P8VMH2_9PEZI|nr:hypothetical protein F5X68DRAFT_257723 [Plectosphaerella plurivora]